MTEAKAPICTFLGLLGAMLTKLFGGWSDDVTTLLIVMAIDFVLGIGAAVVFKNSPKTDSGALSSNTCFRGLCKKGVILLFVLIAYRLDISLGTDYIKTATVIGFITNELISIVENAGLMGVPLPKPLVKAIDLFKDRVDKDA